MATLHIGPIRRERTHRGYLVSAEFRLGRRRRDIWLLTDSDRVSPLADPFLAGALIPAMRRGWSLQFADPISAQVVAGSEQVQRILAGWFKSLRPVTVEAPITAPLDASGRRGVAAFFSGGVDSFYSLQEHLEEVTHLIFVHGFDIALHRVEARARAALSVRTVAGRLGKELIEVTTNWRPFAQPHVGWEAMYFGSALASVAHLLAPNFRRVYVPGGFSADELEPMGSHPELDPHWSSESTQIVQEDPGPTRFAKIRRINDWELVQKHLRVCYQTGDATGMNCGRCRKCSHAGMMLRALGRFDAMETFPHPLDLDALRRFPPTRQFQRNFFNEALAELRQRGADPDLQGVIGSMLDAGGHLPLAGKLARIRARTLNYLEHRFSWGYNRP